MSLYLGNDLIAPNQSSAANKSLSNLDTTGQAVIDSKADVDLSNINASQSAKDTITSWLVPDFDNSIAINTTGLFTAPDNGWIYVWIEGASSGNYTVVYDGETASNNRILSVANIQTTANIFVGKGEKYYIIYAKSAVNLTRFCPVKGVS